MTKMGKYFEIIATAIVVVFFMLMLRRCGDGKVSPTQNDTIKVVETKTVTEYKTDTQYVPQVRKVVEYKTEWKTDTLEIFEKIGIDSTNTFLKDYISYKYYRDSIPVKNGYVIIWDSLHRNTLQNRRIQSNIQETTITRTVTLKEPKRVVAYLGFDLLGSERQFLSSVGANFGLQMKNGKQYEVKAFLNHDGTPTYGFGFKLPIRLKSRQ